MAVDGWFREVLRQSEWLDIAAGPVAGPRAGPALQLRIDETRHTAIVDLDLGHGGEHLAATTLGGRPLHQALDELALRVRLALGDPIATAPLTAARLYSGEVEVVSAVEDALADARIGDFAAASRRLRAVRRRDGASAFLLETMASAASMAGAADDARRLAEEALGLTDRRGPTTTHRLLRTLLLTRASADPQLAGRFDQELLTLAQVGARERPHDPEPRFTLGVARNFLGQFAAAQPVLAELAQRLPDHSGVLYHLGWAALGNGDARTARAAFDQVAASLPARTTFVPRALARFGMGDHEGLRTLLNGMADELLARDDAAVHEVRRMQAAHELLTGADQAAVEVILRDLTWLIAHPRTLEMRAGELADAATVLVQLGAGERLRPHLASIARLWPDTLLADAATYGAGLVDAATGRCRATALEDVLNRRGRGFWADALAAFGHHQLGELTAEQDSLGQAVRESTNPLVKAALIENLRAVGRADEAATLRAALHRELVVVDLRRRSQSPLLGPELALAWRAGDDRVSR